MPKFKITLLVPQDNVVEAASMQDAHEQAKRLVHYDDTNGNVARALVHSITQEKEVEEIDFDIDVPPAVA